MKLRTGRGAFSIILAVIHIIALNTTLIPFSHSQLQLQ